MKNCWEFVNCGREEGGANAEALGVCPACTSTDVNGANRGKNGGRICWAVTGTLCGGEVQGEFAAKIGNCTSCDFYKAVMAEEEAFVMFPSADGVYTPADQMASEAK
jgi:hypothetical protein